MTRRLVIVNLSNHENEDYIIRLGEGDVGVTIAPGDHYDLPVYSRPRIQQ